MAKIEDVVWSFFACSAAIVPAGRDELPLPAEDSAGAHVEVLPGDSDVDPTDTVFDPTVIHTIRITLPDAAWADIRDNPWAETWWTGAVRIDDDEVVDEVGVRAFGAGSLVSGKPSLKLSFDHVVPGQTWRELEQFKLDNSSQDMGFVDERMATQVMRDAGVPAARTGWARVEVNGAPVGFFVLLESIDDRFLTRWFGHDDGPLYGMISGRWGQGLTPTTDPLYYYENQTSVVGDGSEIIRAADALAAGDASWLDTEGFFRESVLRSALGSFDALSADGNNFYLYVDGEQLRIIPWDFDYDLGTSGVATALTVDLHAPWNQSPWSYNAVTGADYEDPVHKWNLAAGADPDTVLAEVADSALHWPTLDAQVVAARDLIQAEVEADSLGYGGYFPTRVADVRLFLHARLSQLYGAEVADCPAPEGTPLAAMAPTGTVGWGSLTVDISQWGPGFNIAGEHYCRGAFAHAPSTVVLTIPDGATQLTGGVGLQDWNQLCGDGSTFTITQADVVLWQSQSKTSYAEAEFFDVGVSPGPLTLTASANAEYSCDTAVWVDVVAR